MVRDLKVLLIDDEERDLLLLRKHLSSLSNFSFKFTQVSSSIEVTSALSANNHYDLIFLDFMLEDKDGFEILSELKSAKANKMPVIFLTGYGNSMVKEDSIALGAKAYLNKNEISQANLEKAILTALSA